LQSLQISHMIIIEYDNSKGDGYGDIKNH